MTLTLILASLALFNLVASIAVLRTSAFATPQRLLQLAVIWLLPVLGAVICGAFVSSQGLGPASPRSIDPLYLPGDGGTPVAGDAGFCGDAGGFGDCGGGGGD